MLVLKFGAEQAMSQTQCVCVCVFIAADLVLVQLAVLILGLALLTECDDDEAHEDVHHEEGDDDDVDDEENGDLHTVVVDGTLILSVGIDGFVQKAEGDRRKNDGEGQGHCRISDAS